MGLCAGATFLLACTDTYMNDINEDVNHPTSFASSFIVTEVLINTAFSVLGGDYNAYIAVCMEHAGCASEQMFETEHR